MSKIPTHKNLQMDLAEMTSVEVPTAQPTVFSVEQLNLQIKQLLEGEFGTIFIQGEISNFKPHTSGHFYFSLKDSRSQITAVMFRGHNSKLKFKPHDGLEVIVRGRISVYEPRGNYQILCEGMEPVGAGALQKAFEQLKEKLRLEGLFESTRKKQIPSLPRHVAIVTSPTGAAIRDILNILKRRAPSLAVTIVPSIVQGDAAVESLCKSMMLAQQLKDVDVIIVGRGGGSIEDMWCFNSEKLARIIADCKIPVISAVGHEIDFTIADFVADLRAPTPSAAAELVSKSNLELIERLKTLGKVLNFTIQKKLNLSLSQLQLISRSLVDPQKKLEDLALRNDDLMTRLNLAVGNYFSHRRSDLKMLSHRIKSPQEVLSSKTSQLKLIENKLSNRIQSKLEMQKAKLQKGISLLNTLSPLSVVERGYAIVTMNKQVVKDSLQIKIGESVEIRLAKGSAVAEIKEVRS